MAEDVQRVRYNTRYRNDSSLAMNLLLLAVIALLGLMALFAVVQFGARAKTYYLRTNAEGRVINPLPLDSPDVISKAALLNWVNDFVINAFSYNYSNQDKQPTKLTEYLNENGLRIYQNLLTQNEDFRNVFEQKFVVTPFMLLAPDIIIAKPYRDRYAWQIRVPVRVEFLNARIKATQELMLDILVVRVPLDESPLGVLIASFNARTTARQAPYSVRSGF